MKDNLIKRLRGKQVFFENKTLKILERKKNISEKKTALFLFDVKKREYISSLYLSPSRNLMFDYKNTIYLLDVSSLKVERAKDLVSIF